MTNVWERFENIVSKEEVAEAGSQFESIEAGNYKATLEALAPSESRSGLPMLKGKFKDVKTNRFIFYNQMLQNINTPHMTAVNIAEANRFVNDLRGEEVEFQTLSELAKRVSEVEIGKEYTVNVSYGKNDTEKKFPKLKIILDDSAESNPYAGLVSVDGDIPF